MVPSTVTRVPRPFTRYIFKLGGFSSNTANSNGFQSSIRRGLAFTRAKSTLATPLPSISSTRRAISNLDGSLSYNQAFSKASRILDTQRVPTERDIREAFMICEQLAEKVDEPQVDGSSAKIHATSALLSLRRNEFQREPTDPASNASQAAEKISKLAFDIVAAPHTFITSKLLAMYVRIQTTLGFPQSFPRVFDLYTTKAIPQAGTSPIRYKEANMKSATAAVPTHLAYAALDSAIEARDLPLCLSIVETTARTPAFKRAKFVRYALLPVTALSLSPLAAYTLAVQLSKLPLFQSTMEPQAVISMITAGFMAYIVFTTMLGVVAVTTSNDQMERITWISGTPLVERWMREDERAMTDRIAMAWGFQERAKRGDEEGEEWNFLRQWAFSKGMLLDKPELMQGME